MQHNPQGITMRDALAAARRIAESNGGATVRIHHGTANPRSWGVHISGTFLDDALRIGRTLHKELTGCALTEAGTIASDGDGVIVWIT